MACSPKLIEPAIRFTYPGAEFQPKFMRTNSDRIAARPIL